MKIIKKIKSFYNTNLKYKESVSLSKWTIALIVFMNINVLSFIYMGISFQTDILNNPTTKYSYNCLSAYKNPNRMNDFTNINYRLHYKVKSNYNKVRNNIISFFIFKV